jgi:hypothetical protein
MPLTAAQTLTAMTAEPSRNVKGGQTVHVHLIFDGLSFVPLNLLTALRTQYGTTKVSSDKDTVSPHGAEYTFRIIP